MRSACENLSPDLAAGRPPPTGSGKCLILPSEDVEIHHKSRKYDGNHGQQLDEDIDGRA